ncbi:MAG: hypothetical protein J5933_03010 [Clostridia bacterium]|nr:hypothetical protein [Clostridia bacterium]
MLKRDRVIVSIVTAAILFSVLLLAVFAEGNKGEEPKEVKYPALEDVDTITGLISDSFEEYMIEAGDRDALFESYAGKLFYGSGTPRLRSVKAVGGRLKGQNKVIYDYVKSAAAEIASGNRASAVVEIPLEDLGVDPGKHYTAEDLGLDYIYNAETEEWNSGVGAAMMTMFDFDSNLIMNSLYSDCPYELYWGRSMSFPVMLKVGMSASSSNGVITAYATFMEPYFPVKVSVESKYRDTSDPEGYTADTEKTGSAANAASYAQGIVDDASEMSDLEKLKFYRDQICELVTYDEYARDHSNTMEDRGPWALIYVFDRDPDTNVVCEGYSEAFQYLCDLTDFDDDRICAYSVTGDMYGGSGGGGGHKWNIVHMDDGYNYIADITNSDEGTWGEDESLFLKGMEGSVDEGYEKHVAEWTEVTGSGIIIIHYEKDINYTYDQETRSIFTDQELTLSARDYGDNPTTDQVAELSGISLFLTEKIGMRIHVLIDTNEVTDDDYIQFEYEGNTFTQSVGNALPGSGETLNDHQRIVIFELPLTATQMSVPVTFHMVVNNIPGEEKTYSVKSYSAQILEEGSGYSRSAKDLVKAMLHYGTFAQLYVGENTDDLPNEGYEFIWSDSDFDKLANYQYELTSNSGNDLKLYSSSLAMETDLSVRFYFDIIEGFELEDFGISVNDNEGHDLDYVNGLNEETGKSYIIVQNISPLDIGKMIHLTITENDSQIVDLSYGPLSYCYAKITGSGTSAKIKNLCKAIFKYYLAASKYEAV